MSSPTSELKHTLVRAGAGAGKTRGLVEKVVEVYQLFRKNGEVPRIILTTFTRKATQELKERLITKACDLRDAKLLQFVSDPSKLQILTIHGLLNTFLKQVGHLAGLEAGFQVLSTEEATKMARLSLRDVVLKHPDGLVWLETYGFDRVLEMCRGFEPKFREHPELAAASLTDLQALAEEEFDRWRVLLNEFAASILEEVDDPKWNEYAHHLAAFAAAWKGGDLEALPGKVRRPPKSKPSPWESWHQRADDLYKDIKYKFDDERNSKIWQAERWPKMVDEWNQFLPLAKAFAEDYGKLKEGQGRLEMTDLELKTLEILRTHSYLASVFSSNWDFWMIDEYQDTSPVQVACLKALMGEHSRRYVVGDPQQSIYLFRGAEVQVFDQAQAEIESLGGDILHLRTNYRSRPDLLEFMNHFMGSVGESFSPMKPKPEEKPLLREINEPCALLVKAADQASEMKAVVSRIEELVNQGARLEDICVLGRTHRTLLDVSKALKAYGYPTHVHSARGFSNRREIIDAGALWKFLVNPHDNLNLMVLLRSPWFYVADHQLALWMKDKPQSLWRYLSSRTEIVAAPEGESLRRLTTARKQLELFGIAHAFEETLRSSAYLDLCLVNDPAGRKESNLWKLIWKARALVKESGHSPLDLLGESKGDPTESSEGDAASAQEPNCINLMTIHGSKGLEFEHVIIPGAGQSPNKSRTASLTVLDGKMSFPFWDREEGSFVASPMDYFANQIQRQKEMNEFDRWLYVAVTRAKGSLTLTWSQNGRDSWASRSAWFEKAVGVYNQDSFSVEVRDLDWEPSHYKGAKSSSMSVRPPWYSLIEGKLRQPLEGTQSTSVSDLVAKKARPSKVQKDVLRQWNAQSVGLEIHRAMESLKYGNPSEEATPSTAYVLGLVEPPMASIISSGQVEWGFQVKTDKGVIEGQIDLWGIHNGKIYVVDYKTGSERAIEDSFRQLSLYGWALRRFGLASKKNSELADLPIEMIVLYPLKEKLEKRDFTRELFETWEEEFSRT